MDILRRDLENKARCEALVEMKLDDMGISEMAKEDTGAKAIERIRVATKEYFMWMLQEHLSNSQDNILTQYFDESELAVWGFIAGFRACLKGQPAQCGY